MDQETLKQAGRFYRCIILQLIWLALIIVIALTGITQTNQIAKSLIKYFAIAYALFLLFILIYFPGVKKIGINKLMDYMSETTKPLPFFAQRTFEQNVRLGRIFSYGSLVIFIIINYFINMINWQAIIFIATGAIILDIIFYLVGFYNFLNDKIKK